MNEDLEYNSFGWSLLWAVGYSCWPIWTPELHVTYKLIPVLFCAHFLLFFYRADLRLNMLGQVAISFVINYTLRTFWPYLGL